MPRETFVQKLHPNGRYVLVHKEDLSAWMEKHYPNRHKFTWRPKPVQRGSWVWRDGGLIPKHLAPPRRRNSDGLQVIKDIEPFQNIAVDNGYIGGRRQRKDMMKAHGLIEVGNEPPINRKQHPEFSPREFAEDMKSAFREHGVDAL